MESLIIIILFLALSSISGGKRRKKHPPAGSEQQHNEQTLTGQIRQLFDEMLQNDASSQRSSTRQRRTRSAAQSAEQQCGYCTGEVEVAQAVEHKSTTEPLQVLVPQNDIPLVDVKAVQWGFRICKTLFFGRKFWLNRRRCVVIVINNK